MKTIFYLLIAIFMTANLTSCTADSVANDEDISAELVSTDNDTQYGDEDESGN